VGSVGLAWTGFGVGNRIDAGVARTQIWVLRVPQHGPDKALGRHTNGTSSLLPAFECAFAIFLGMLLLTTPLLVTSPRTFVPEKAPPSESSSPISQSSASPLAGPQGDPNSGWIPDVEVTPGIGDVVASPAIATGPGGVLHAVWAQRVAFNSDIVYSSSADSGITWSSPIRVASSGNQETSPDIAVSASTGRIFVAYVNASIVVDVAYSDGAAWNRTQIFPFNFPPANVSVMVTYDNPYDVFVAFQGRRTPGPPPIWQIEIWRSADAGLTFSPSLLPGGSGIEADPELAYQVGTDGVQRVSLAYVNGTALASVADLSFRSYNRTSPSWTAAQLIQHSTYPVESPSIAASRNGAMVMIAWQVSDPATCVPAHVYDSDPTSPTTGWTSGVLVFPRNPGTDCDPELAADGEGLTSSGIGGFFHLVWSEGGYDLRYSSRPTVANASWGLSVNVTDASGRPSSLGFSKGITTELRPGGWSPGIVWADFRSGSTTDIFYTTPGGRVIVDTAPPGLLVAIDSSPPSSAPQNRIWAAGTLHDLSTPSPQVLPGLRYTWSGWSDGQPQTHTVLAGSVDSAFIAVFDVEYQLVVRTEPPGLQIRIDAGTFSSPYAFWCPNGTTVTLGVITPQTVGNTRYVFSTWSDGGAQAHTITCTDPAEFTAYFGQEYSVTVQTSPPGLELEIDAILQVAPYSFWCTSGSSHSLRAVSPQVVGSIRYVFISWSDGGDASHPIICAGPTSYTASFRTDYAVRIDTSPGSLEIEIDGTSSAAPADMWWTEGSIHTIRVPSPQGIGTSRHIFSSWSDGGPRNRTLAITGPLTLIAVFGTEYRILVETLPGGRQVEVDGSPQTAPYLFWCGALTWHNLSVPSPQTLGSTRYVFFAWSNGGSRTHVILCTEAATFAALFDTEYEITITTSPPGLQVEVQGSTQGTPYAYWCQEGSTLSLGVPSPQTSGQSRFVFDSWSDGGLQDHGVACSAPGGFSASFFTEHEVRIDTSPSALVVLVDSRTLASPLVLWWRDGSTHVVAIPSPQGTGSTRFVFTLWLDGGPQNRTLAINGPGSFTASFATEYVLTVGTVPPGLLVEIDGFPRYAPTDSWCLANSAPTLSAPSPQQAGRERHAFVSWSDGGPPSHVVSCDLPRVLTADFRQEFEVTVDTVPSGLDVEVNSSWYVAPVIFWWAAGSSHSLSVNVSQQSRLFSAWSDGGATAHTVTITGPSNFVAVYCAGSPPRVVITAPAPAEAIPYSTSSLSVFGTSQDADRVEVRFTGGTWTEASGTDTWTASFILDPVASGPLVIEARAFAGLLESPHDRIVVLLEGPPEPPENPPVTPWTSIWIPVIAFGGGTATGLLYRRFRPEPKSQRPEEPERPKGPEPVELIFLGAEKKSLPIPKGKKEKKKEEEKDLPARLAELEELRDRGKISEKEYQKRRRELLEGE